MKRYSYKVEFFPIEELKIETGIRTANVEEHLNEYAARGWRLRETALCGQLGLICIFEREDERG
jgi:hypothetical protein